MTELCMEAPVETIAGMIRRMDENEVETLSFLLSPQGAEIFKRKDEIDTDKVTLISRDEVFDV